MAVFVPRVPKTSFENGLSFIYLSLQVQHCEIRIQNKILQFDPIQTECINRYLAKEILT